jgi:hypothetical protein
MQNDRNTSELCTRTPLRDVAKTRTDMDEADRTPRHGASRPCQATKLTQVRLMLLVLAVGVFGISLIVAYWQIL